MFRSIRHSSSHYPHWAFSRMYIPLQRSWDRQIITYSCVKGALSIMHARYKFLLLLNQSFSRKNYVYVPFFAEFSIKRLLQPLISRKQKEIWHWDNPFHPFFFFMGGRQGKIRCVINIHILWVNLASVLIIIQASELHFQHFDSSSKGNQFRWNIQTIAIRTYEWCIEIWSRFPTTNQSNMASSFISLCNTSYAIFDRYMFSNYNIILYLFHIRR